MKSIGIDIGGTAIKFALIGDGQTILVRAGKPTPRGDPAALADRISELIRENVGDCAQLPIGIACAGDVLKKMGIPAGEVSILLVNGFHKTPETPVKDGDIVALFPPVGGG